MGGSAELFRSGVRPVALSLRAVKSARPQFVWALQDVTFDVEESEVIGLIGPNGAGKTTLLKLLSRITAPTEGRAVLRGRVGSLLEVGTGFHPELTGRENVYLTGAILGMRRAEIRRKYAEIAEFAEIGNYIDTPVKRYSSGMQVRLGFAVAAHLESEILIVDEVLAVGDADFQEGVCGRSRTWHTGRPHRPVRQPQPPGRPRPLRPGRLPGSGPTRRTRRCIVRRSLLPRAQRCGFARNEVERNRSAWR